MSDQNKQPNEDMHIMARSVAIDFPEDIRRLIEDAVNQFMKIQLESGTLEDAEKNTEEFINGLKSMKGSDTPDDSEAQNMGAAIWEQIRQTTREIILSHIDLARTAALYAELIPFINRELEKPEYGGLTLHEMIEGYHNSEGGGQYLERMYHRAMYNAQMTWELDQLQPYIDKELKRGAAAYKGKTAAELWAEAVPNDDTLVFIGWEIDPGSLFAQLLEAARAVKDAEQAKRTEITKTNKLDFPLDKINSRAWSLLEKDTAGQISFNVAKNGSREKVPIYYAIDFENLGQSVKISKRLTPFDKRVYMAVSALFNAGNNVITLAQIYKHMGYRGRAGSGDLEKINGSIDKMQKAQIYLDNQLEAERYPGYSKFVYKGSLLPLETGELYNVQGALTDAAIHIFREPPLMYFARQRKQITTIDLKLLQSPLNKTDDNLQIEDYLIERISKAKNGKGRSCRILFKTLYDHVGISEKPRTEAERSAKKRAPKKIEKYLKYQQEHGFISRFTVQADGVTVFWN